MNREKVLELAREADACHDDIRVTPFLERFAALIEREVRGDAEPVAWYTEDHLTDKSATTWSKDATNRWRSKGWPVFSLYAHPSPAVVQQLVEATKRAMNYAENVVMAEGVYFDDDDDLPFIESALLAAKEAGL